MRTGAETAIRASYVVILIGACPDLSFLASGILSSLGVVPGASIESKHNPVDIDPFTYSSHRHPGLYAMGPLVGDNFVRFLRGGSLAIASDICQERQEREKCLLDVIPTAVTVASVVVDEKEKTVCRLLKKFRIRK